MPHPVKTGKKTRMSFSKINEVAPIPSLIQIQVDSYDWFIQEGLKEVFEDISPIKDYAGNLVLEFIDNFFFRDIKRQRLFVGLHGKKRTVKLVESKAEAHAFANAARRAPNHAADSCHCNASIVRKALQVASDRRSGWNHG